MIERLAVAATFCLAGGLMGAQLTGVVQVAGQHIPGATLTATQAERKISTATDESGQYVFADLAAGRWSVEVAMFGFATASREVTIGAEAVTANWTLEWKPRAAAPPAPARRPAPDNRQANVNLTQSAEDEILAALDAPANRPATPTPEATSDANQSFLVSGSVSRGLGDRPPDELFGPPGMEMQRGMMGPGGPGGGPGGGRGPVPGFGGGEGPRFGGPGGPGGPGGFGGGDRVFIGRGGGPPGGPFERGRGGPGGRPTPGDRTSFGNRRNRGREGLRGAASFSLRNSALDARPYSLTGQTLPKPSYAQSRFGLSAGGQLRIPKLIHSERTFFFVDFSGSRSRNPYNATTTLPTPLERAGDFSQSRALIIDPAARAPFAGSRVPANRWSQAATGLLSFFPLPNQPGVVQNYQYLTSTPQNSNNLNLRVNQRLTRRDNVSFSFNLQNRNGQHVQLYGFRDDSDGRGLNSNLSWIHTLSRRLINRASFNFSRNRSELVPFFAFKRNVAAELGIVGTAADPINYGPPNLSFTNFGGLSDNSAYLRRDQNAAVSDSLTVVRGRHNITVGGEYRRTQLNNRTDQNARGSFTFTGLATSDFDARGLPLPGTGYDFADFLLGLPQSSSVRFGSSNTYFRGSVGSFYGQNDWRLRPNLTLNLGVRYELFQPFEEKFGHMANLDIAPGFTGVAVVTPGQPGLYTGAFPAALIDPDTNNVSPRLGLAWRPFAQKRFQIRAGYGLFHNGSIYNQFPSRLASQPPFANTATFSTSLARTLTLEDGFGATPSTTITNTYAVDRRYRIGYAQTWNFAISQDLPHALVLELGYLGTKGTRLDMQRIPNRAAPGSPLTAEQRRQIGNAVGFTFDSSEANSVYHAAQVRLTRRFRRGLSANAFYTWSKSIDNASTFGGGGAVVAQNDKDLAAERGLSSFDQRHTINLLYNIASPVGGASSILRGDGLLVHLLEDWNLSGGLTAGSGTPLTARVLGNQADAGGTGSVGSGRADASGAAVDASGRFFNLAAFILPPAGRFGNAARNTVPGPNWVSLNMSISRSFRMGDERRRLELRAESSNFTNHVSFAGLGTVVNASNYGLPTGTRPMRSMSASLRFRF